MTSVAAPETETTKPRRSESRQRQQLAYTRLTPAELAIAREVAERQGTSVSALIRKLLLQASAET